MNGILKGERFTIFMASPLWQSVPSCLQRTCVNFDSLLTFGAPLPLRKRHTVRHINQSLKNLAGAAALSCVRGCSPYRNDSSICSQQKRENRKQFIVIVKYLHKIFHPAGGSNAGKRSVVVGSRQRGRPPYIAIYFIVPTPNFPRDCPPARNCTVKKGFKSHPMY